MAIPVVPVTISSGAAAEIYRIRKDKNVPAEYGLRVGVRSGGCAGKTFFLGFDKKRTDDVAYFLADLLVLVARPHVLYVVGKVVDFYEAAEEKGFAVVDAEG